MQQGLLCNDMGLPSMGQQPGHGQLPYGDTGLDPSLGASMANLGLQGSLMDSLQGSHWQVGAHNFCECLVLPGQKEGMPRKQLSAVRALQQFLLQGRAPILEQEPCAASCSSPRCEWPACHPVMG